MRRGITRHKVGLVALVVGVGGAMVGFLLAPPLAEAHRGGLHAEVHHGLTPRAANVSGGRLHTFNRGGHIEVRRGFVEVATVTFVIAEGTGDGAPQTICEDFAVLDGVSATGSGVIEVRGDTTFDGTPGDVMWRGEATGTVETMFGGKQTWSASDLEVTAAPGLEWIVYGFCEGGPVFPQSEEMRAKAQEVMGRR